MAYSQNGWPVRTSTNLVWFAAGGRRWSAADQDVATVAAYFITRFHAEVERVDVGVFDDWSFAPRLVRGSSTTISNHASATAWDLNATQHPRGVEDTFSTRQIRAVNAILDDVVDDSGNRVLRWGEMYAGTVDGMHIEIDAGPRSVHQAAQRIRARMEDDVTPEDRAKIIVGVADEMMKRLATQRLVPNVRLSPDDKPARDMTVVGVLSNVELNQDQQTRQDARRYTAAMTEVRALNAQVEALTAAVQALTSLAQQAAAPRA